MYKRLCIILLLPFVVDFIDASGDDDSEGPKIVCYYSSWSVYREDAGHFNLSHIDPTLCTHLVYTFAGLDISSRITSLDPNVDYCAPSNQLCKGGFKGFAALKQQNPRLKTILAIGGWNEGSRKYSVMASTEESRKEFVESVLRFLAAYDFDGFDFDWEYPSQRGGILSDKDNFIELLKLLKERLHKWNLTLSIAVPISEDITETAFDVAKINEYVDYINLMAYDYTAPDSKKTGLLSPMSSIEKSIKIWKDGGLDTKKLVLGMPSYARTFRLKDENQNGIDAPTNGTYLGIAGKYTKEPGFLAHYELKPKLESLRYTEVTKDENTYAYYKTEWLTYDTIASYIAKTKYALEKNLGGVMLWSIDTDDFLNGYPILTAIHEEVVKHKHLTTNRT